MAVSISNPDAVAPSAPASLTATGSISSVALSWPAATDNVGVVRYNVHRGTTAGFTPTTANRVAQPTGTTYTDTGLAAGTYYYRVTAEDAAGNVGPRPRRHQRAATGDVTAPSAPARSPRVQAPAARDSRGERPTTTWRSPGTTCTGRRRPASRRPPRTASRR